MSDFNPTHLICLDNGRRIEVELIDGAAYTREECETYTNADYEKQDNGTWTFQGQVFNGRVYPLNERGVPNVEKTAAENGGTAYYISTDSSSQTIRASSLDEAAKIYAVGEGWSGVTDLETMRDYIERHDGILHAARED
jgi:hypothetical protein